MQLYDKDRMTRRTIADAIEVLRNQSGFSENSRAQYRIRCPRSPAAGAIPPKECELNSQPVFAAGFSTTMSAAFHPDVTEQFDKSRKHRKSEEIQGK